MLEVFIYESTTLLDQLDEILLDSEKEKQMNEENVNEIFRIMHTLKGSSAMMGLNAFSNLAHAVEDVFAIVREDRSKMDNVSETIFNLVFQASDFLKVEIEGIQGDDYAPKDPADLIQQLHSLADVMNGTKPPNQPRKPLPSARKGSARSGCISKMAARWKMSVRSCC